MLTYQQSLSLPACLFEGYGSKPEAVLFFDIETTGFSADTSFLYLICVGFLSDGKPVLRQWFSESFAEEALLLDAFFSFLPDYTALVHFNGSTFDLPYLLKKCAQHERPYNFSSIASVDLFRSLQPYKKTFSLPGCRQKDIEAALGICRKDQYDGGQLIEVYKQYLGRARFDKMAAQAQSFQDNNASSAHTKNILHIPEATGLPRLPASPSEALLYLLLLHNAEDVEGLISISCLLPLIQMLDGTVPEYSFVSLTEVALTVSLSCFRTTDAEPAASPACSGIAQHDFSVSSHLSCFLPEGKQFQHGLLSFSRSGSALLVHIPVYQGELKYFFEDYKNYYYLPAEDCAIHKSVGEGVDKANRKQATAATCYTKKSGCFLPQTDKRFSPCFQKEKKGEVTYFEMEKLNAEGDSGLLTDYVNSLFC